jgi:hypothetical protein
MTRCSRAPGPAANRSTVLTIDAARAANRRDTVALAARTVQAWDALRQRAPDTIGDELRDVMRATATALNDVRPHDDRDYAREIIAFTDATPAIADPTPT